MRNNREQAIVTDNNADAPDPLIRHTCDLAPEPPAQPLADHPEKWDTLLWAGRRVQLTLIKESEYADLVAMAEPKDEAADDTRTRKANIRAITALRNTMTQKQFCDKLSCKTSGSKPIRGLIAGPKMQTDPDDAQTARWPVSVALETGFNGAGSDAADVVLHLRAKHLVCLCACMDFNSRAVLERRQPQGILRIFAESSKHIGLKEACLVLRTGRQLIPGTADTLKYAQQKSVVRKPCDNNDNIQWNARVDLLVYDYTEERLCVEIHEKNDFGKLFGSDSFQVDQWEPGRINYYADEDLDKEDQKKGRTNLLSGLASRIPNPLTRRKQSMLQQKLSASAGAGSRPLITFRVQFLPFSQVLDTTYAAKWSKLPPLKTYNDQQLDFKRGEGGGHTTSPAHSGRGTGLAYDSSMDPLMIPDPTDGRPNLGVECDGRLNVGVFYLKDFPTESFGNPGFVKIDMRFYPGNENVGLPGKATSDPNRQETFEYDWGTAQVDGKLWFCEHFNFALGNKDDKVKLSFRHSKIKHIAYEMDLTVKELYEQTGSQGVANIYTFTKQVTHTLT